VVCEITLFFVSKVFIYTTNNVFMKPEYKEKALENLNGIANRAVTIKDMMEGKRPANQAEAIRLVREIERLAELTSNVVDIA